MQADCCVCICTISYPLTSLQQEVKESAITCMGLVISTFGDELKKELPSCLPVLVDRMGNEITRLTAVKVVLVLLLTFLFPKFFSMYVILLVHAGICCHCHFSAAH